MSSVLRSGVVLAALMLAASVFAVVLRPTEVITGQEVEIDFETIVPKQFGEWHIDQTIRPVLPAPDVQEKLDTIYNKTLARTYVNSRGQRIMLSIAYGKEQRKQSQVHRPEVCYPAQGFTIDSRKVEDVETPRGRIPVLRLLAKANNRVEPITYWIRIGDKIVRGYTEQKIATVTEGLTGRVVDGLLFRVSSIGSNAPSEYRLQEQFIIDLISVMDGVSSRHLIGIPEAASAQK